MCYAEGNPAAEGRAVGWSGSLTIPKPIGRFGITSRARRGRAGGRAPSLDQQTYKGRNVIEGSFALLKQWRGLATRYDKLAITYRAAAVLGACITWTRHMGDTLSSQGKD